MFRKQMSLTTYLIFKKGHAEGMLCDVNLTLMRIVIFNCAFWKPNLINPPSPHIIFFLSFDLK